MSLGDLLLLVIRWIHGVAAAVWIGGSLFYLFIAKPAFSNPTEHDHLANRRLGKEFRGVSITAIWIMIITGTLITVSRLATGHLTYSYIIALVVKILIAFWMFYTVWVLEPRNSSIKTNPPNGFMRILTNPAIIVIGGLTIFLLADLLGLLFEKSITI